jgi:polygalacturonase
VENCTFDVGDDAICLKSGKDKAGRVLAMPCET